MSENGFEVVDFSMQDERNFPSPFSSFFISNVAYHNNSGVLSKISQLASFIHSEEAVKKIKKLIVSEKPVIAHLHNIYHQITPSIIHVAKRQGVKTVLTLHDYKLVCPGYLALNGTEICTRCNGRNFTFPLKLHCQRSYGKELLLALESFWHLRKKSYEKVDLFLAPSQFVADLVGRRIDKSKIKVLRNGIETDEYHPNYSDQGYGLYFGRLSKEKGIETLLQAHERMAISFPLKIIGTGPLSDTLQAKFPAAEFLGYRSGEELKSLVANAAFVIVPSEWYENCSMVVLESMALGKPVIGAEIGGLPEQIENEKTGLLFVPNDVDDLRAKMEHLASDKVLRVAMGKKARLKLEREYSLDGHCRQLLEYYAQLTQ